MERIQQFCVRHQQVLSSAASERNINNRSRKRLQSYPEEVNYWLKNVLTAQTIVELIAVILRYMYPANVVLQQYADDPVAKSCMVADIYGEGTGNDVFIQDVNLSIYDSLRHYWAQNSGFYSHHIPNRVDAVHTKNCRSHVGYKQEHLKLRKVLQQNTLE